MTVGKAPQPRRPYLPSAPSPDVYDRMIDDLIAEAQRSKAEFRWLYRSGYEKGRKGGGEKVRRDISGTGGDLAAVVAGGKPGRETPIDRVRRHLAESADHVRKSLAHIKGSDTALGRAQEAVDSASKPTLVALDPLEPAIADKPFTPDHLRGMTPTEAKGYQKQRKARVAASSSPFASEEITG